MRPGILVQRQSKEMVATLLESKEGIEGNESKAENEVKENHDDENAKGNGQEVMGFSTLKGQ